MAAPTEGERLRHEQSRLIAEVERAANTERLAWGFNLGVTVSNLAFALAPLVPRSEHVFGALTASRAVLFVVPSVVATCAKLLAARVFAAEHRVVRAIEALETLCFYGILLAFIHESGLRWSPIWALCPFTAIFWALTKPFHSRLYLPLIGVAHALLTVVWVGEGKVPEAVVSVGVGVLSCATFEIFARRRRTDVMLEAERNVLRVRLRERQLDAERDRLAASLVETLASRLTRLRERLEQLPGRSSASVAAAEQAENALRELSAFTSGERTILPRSLEQLGQLIEAKCAPLALEASYAQSVTGDRAAPLATSTTLAALRIAQELVRNAVTHA